MWLDKKNLQLCRAKTSEYIREVFSIRYEIKYYNNKAKHKTKNGRHQKIPDHRFRNI